MRQGKLSGEHRTQVKRLVRETTAEAGIGGGSGQACWRAGNPFARRHYVADGSGAVRMKRKRKERECGRGCLEVGGRVKADEKEKVDGRLRQPTADDALRRGLLPKRKH